ncbi:unnamed protein product [Cylicocyclus nassatus]|uniref:Uncharacterized protein n=1 Tax=Cylicocyclus nassatus TaxID=53992 RepID=A0AA36DPQ0_CYLNA|nr:unnamed protein product [Cylicocyclus nassatus]
MRSRGSAYLYLLCLAVSIGAQHDAALKSNSGDWTREVREIQQTEVKSSEMISEEKQESQEKSVDPNFVKSLNEVLTQFLRDMATVVKESPESAERIREADVAHILKDSLAAAASTTPPSSSEQRQQSSSEIPVNNSLTVNKVAFGNRLQNGEKEVPQKQNSTKGNELTGVVVSQKPQPTRFRQRLQKPKRLPLKIATRYGREKLMNRRRPFRPHVQITRPPIRKQTSQPRKIPQESVGISRRVFRERNFNGAWRSRFPAKISRPRGKPLATSTQWRRRPFENLNRRYVKTLVKKPKTLLSGGTNQQGRTPTSNTPRVVIQNREGTDVSEVVTQVGPSRRPILNRSPSLHSGSSPADARPPPENFRARLHVNQSPPLVGPAAHSGLPTDPKKPQLNFSTEDSRENVLPILQQEVRPTALQTFIAKETVLNDLVFDLLKKLGVQSFEMKSDSGTLKGVSDPRRTHFTPLELIEQLAQENREHSNTSQIPPNNVNMPRQPQPSESNETPTTTAQVAGSSETITGPFGNAWRQTRGITRKELRLLRVKARQ